MPAPVRTPLGSYASSTSLSSATLASITGNPGDAIIFMLWHSSTITSASWGSYNLLPFIAQQVNSTTIVTFLGVFGLVSGQTANMVANFLATTKASIIATRYTNLRATGTVDRIKGQSGGAVTNPGTGLSALTTQAKEQLVAMLGHNAGTAIGVTAPFTEGVEAVAGASMRLQESYRYVTVTGQYAADFTVSPAPTRYAALLVSLKEDAGTDVTPTIASAAATAGTPAEVKSHPVTRPTTATAVVSAPPATQRWQVLAPLNQAGAAVTALALLVQVSVLPSAATASFPVVAVSVVGGARSLAPSLASASFSAGSPALAPGARERTPTAASFVATASSVSEILVGDTERTLLVATVAVVAQTTSLDPADAPPRTPTAASMVASAGTPQVVLATTIVSPSAATCVVSAPGVALAGLVVKNPSAAQVSSQAGSVSIDSAMRPSAAVCLAIAATPTLAIGGRERTPTAASFAASAPTITSLVVGGPTVSPSAALASLSALAAGTEPADAPPLTVSLAGVPCSARTPAVSAGGLLASPAVAVAAWSAPTPAVINAARCTPSAAVASASALTTSLVAGVNARVAAAGFIAPSAGREMGGVVVSQTLPASAFSAPTLAEILVGDARVAPSAAALAVSALSATTDPADAPAIGPSTAMVAALAGTPEVVLAGRQATPSAASVVVSAPSSSLHGRVSPSLPSASSTAGTPAVVLGTAQLLHTVAVTILSGPTPTMAPGATAVAPSAPTLACGAATPSLVATATLSPTGPTVPALAPVCAFLAGTIAASPTGPQAQALAGTPAVSGGAAAAQANLAATPVVAGTQALEPGGRVAGPSFASATFAAPAMTIVITAPSAFPSVATMTVIAMVPGIQSGDTLILPSRPTIVFRPQQPGSSYAAASQQVKPLTMLRAVGTLGDADAATTIVVGPSTVSGPLVVSAAALVAAARPGAIESVVFYALGRKPVTGGPVATASTSRFTWNVGPDSDSFVDPGDPFPESSDVNGFAVFASDPIPTQPDGSPWDWAGVEALAAVAVTQEFTVAPGQHSILGVAELWVEVLGVEALPTSPVEAVVSMQFGPELIRVEIEKNELVGATLGGPERETLNLEVDHAVP